MPHSMPSSSASRPSDSPWAAGRTRGEAVKVGVRWLEWGRGTEPRHWEMEMAMKDMEEADHRRRGRWADDARPPSAFDDMSTSNPHDSTPLRQVDQALRKLPYSSLVPAPIPHCHRVEHLAYLNAVAIWLEKLAKTQWQYLGATKGSDLSSSAP